MEQRNISFPSDNLTIRGTLVMPGADYNRPVPGVIIFHGMTSSEKGYVPLAQSLAGHGIAGLAVSMRGHGRSDGDFHKETVEAALVDAVSAYDFLVSWPGIDTDRIGMVGSSVGAILAAMATQQRDVKSLVLRAPAAYPTELMQVSMAATMANEANQFHKVDELENTPAGKAVKDFSGSMLVVASEHDAIIPLLVSQGYLDIVENARRSQLTIIKGATHKLTDPMWQEELIQTAVDWFKKTL